MSDGLVLLEREERIATVTLNRPDALNALSPELLGELAEAVEAASTDAKVRCIIITGSEKAFAAGADVNEFPNLTDEREAYEQVRAGQQIFTRLEQLRPRLHGFQLMRRQGDKAHRHDQGRYKSPAHCTARTIFFGDGEEPKQSTAKQHPGNLARGHDHDAAETGVQAG